MPNVLTLAMACYRSFDSLYFTALDARKSHGWDFDLLAVDNAPESCPRTRTTIVNSCGGRYYHRPDLNGTSRPRNACFHYATTPWVMVVDDHVLFDNGAIAAAIRYAEQHPKSKDIVTGPILGDDGRWVSTHWTSGHAHNLWGTWACDPKFQSMWGNPSNPAWRHGSARAAVDRMEPFEIPAMGLGMWMMRKDAWPEFNPHFRGFGGEEGYIHEKVRRLGGKAICHPRIRWHHKFRDIGGQHDKVPYPLDLESHTRNLLLGSRELGIDCVDDVWQEFGKRLNGGRPEFDRILADVKYWQPWNTLYSKPKLKILALWYTNNGAPEALLQSSLKTIHEAQNQSHHDVVVATSTWSPIPGNPFPGKTIDPSVRTLPGHHAIIKQIRDAWASGVASRKPRTGDREWAPDVICFCEHDVLYPPGYFDRIGDAFAANPSANVVSHHDYIGLNATGWLNVRERHDPMHQLAMRAETAAANLDRAEADCVRQGWAYLEPDHASDRSKWVTIRPDGFAPSVHVNW